MAAASTTRLAVSGGGPDLPTFAAGVRPSAFRALVGVAGRLTFSCIECIANVDALSIGDIGVVVHVEGLSLKGRLTSLVVFAALLLALPLSTTAVG